jgi:hypothetical protein
MRKKTWTAIGAVALGFVSTSLVAAGSKDREALSRSFYVSVEVEVCEHIHGAVLYRGDDPLVSLPGEHVFQFTFFPSLGRIEPEWDRVRVEGTLDGRPFRTEIVVTPATVYVGNRKIDLDLDGLMSQLRTRVDARHDKVELKLRCSTTCARARPASSR